ncbi:MAG: saccharopine dehydrogenase C-terminal domain-containing protein [Chitinophagaceae bacterium]
MKIIVLFGAGKSSTVLIDYLKQICSENIWQAFVADADLNLAQSKVGNHPLVKAIRVDIKNENERQTLIEKADVVISLMPPDLHFLLAKDCIQFSKHLLTASYVSDEIKKLQSEIIEKKILFLCEMGLDPGIDHMSAMKIIHQVQKQGGEIISFKSHCGGLVAPENDDNPWHYKISWNARNVVLAGKAGAVYKENGKEVHKNYEELFVNNPIINIGGIGDYAYYPNRDSLSYISLYGLNNAQTFLRTTLRHPEFCFGWKNIIDIKLTDEKKVYETGGLTIAEFFKQHFEKHGFSDWLNNMLMSRLNYAKEMMEKLMQLMEAEEASEAEGEEPENDFMMVDDKGELAAIDVDDVKNKAAETVASQMHEANLSMKQLFFLGMDDDETQINKGLCSAADVLQFILEKKLALNENGKDMIVMMHEIEYSVDDRRSTVDSLLVVKGENNLRTAMAKTVGLPLGIAAKLILEEKIKETGLHIPVIPSIYEPVLNKLENYGIVFHETKM